MNSDQLLARAEAAEAALSERTRALEASHKREQQLLAIIQGTPEREENK